MSSLSPKSSPRSGLPDSPNRSPQPHSLLASQAQSMGWEPGVSCYATCVQMHGAASNSPDDSKHDASKPSRTLDSLRHRLKRGGRKKHKSHARLNNADHRSAPPVLVKEISSQSSLNSTAPAGNLLKARHLGVSAEGENPGGVRGRKRSVSDSKGYHVRDEPESIPPPIAVASRNMGWSSSTNQRDSNHRASSIGSQRSSPVTPTPTVIDPEEETNNGEDAARALRRHTSMTQYTLLNASTPPEPTSPGSSTTSSPTSSTTTSPTAVSPPSIVIPSSDEDMNVEPASISPRGGAVRKKMGKRRHSSTRRSGLGASNKPSADPSPAVARRDPTVPPATLAKSLSDTRLPKEVPAGMDDAEERSAYCYGSGAEPLAKARSPRSLKGVAKSDPQAHSNPELLRDACPVSTTLSVPKERRRASTVTQQRSPRVPSKQTSSSASTSPVRLPRDSPSTVSPRVESSAASISAYAYGAADPSSDPPSAISELGGGAFAYGVAPSNSPPFSLTRPSVSAGVSPSSPPLTTAGSGFAYGASPPISPPGGGGFAYGASPGDDDDDDDDDEDEEEEEEDSETMTAGGGYSYGATPMPSSTLPSTSGYTRVNSDGSLGSNAPSTGSGGGGGGGGGAYAYNPGDVGDYEDDDDDSASSGDEDEDDDDAYRRDSESDVHDEDNDEGDEEADDIVSRHGVQLINFEKGEGWNSKFQAMLAREDGIEKFRDLGKAAHDFAYMAKTYGKIIISERFLAQEHKTIKSVNIGGVAGGDKYICQGILFKFALDTKIKVSATNYMWMYGGQRRSDEKAMKAAGHDLSGLVSYHNTETPGLHYPLMALIDYRGHRLTSQSFLPLGKDTLKYGSADGGNSIHKDNPELNKKMKVAALALNLAGHQVFGRKIYGAGDLEGHVGHDGKFYVIDFARTFPPEAPLLKSKYDRSVFYKHLRPELVRRFRKPLSSDAFTYWGIDNYHEHNADIIEATEFLHTKIIANFAKRIDKTFANKDPRTAKDFRLTEAMHREGINARHLGRVVEHCKNIKIVQMLVTEMLARAIKSNIRLLLRRTMAGVRLPVEEPYRGAVLDFLNRLLHKPSVTEEATLKEEATRKEEPENDNMSSTRVVGDIWSGGIRASLLEKFGWPKKTEHLPLILRESVNILALFLRLQALTGVRISKQAMKELERRHDSKGTEQFVLLDADIEKISAKVKHLNLVDMASANALYLEAKMSTGLQADRLWDLAALRFEAAAASSTMNARTMFNWGEMLFEKATRAEAGSRVNADTILAAAAGKYQAAVDINKRSNISLFRWGLVTLERARLCVYGSIAQRNLLDEAVVIFGRAANQNESCLARLVDRADEDLAGVTGRPCVQTPRVSKNRSSVSVLGAARTTGNPRGPIDKVKAVEKENADQARKSASRLMNEKRDQGLYYLIPTPPRLSETDRTVRALLAFHLAAVVRPSFKYFLRAGDAICELIQKEVVPKHETVANKQHSLSQLYFDAALMYEAAFSLVLAMTDNRYLYTCDRSFGAKGGQPICPHCEVGLVLSFGSLDPANPESEDPEGHFKCPSCKYVQSGEGASGSGDRSASLVHSERDHGYGGAFGDMDADGGGLSDELSSSSSGSKKSALNSLGASAAHLGSTLKKTKKSNGSARGSSSAYGVVSKPVLARPGSFAQFFGDRNTAPNGGSDTDDARSSFAAEDLKKSTDEARRGLTESTPGSGCHEVPERRGSGHSAGFNTSVHVWELSTRSWCQTFEIPPALPPVPPLLLAIADISFGDAHIWNGGDAQVQGGGATIEGTGLSVGSSVKASSTWTDILDSSVSSKGPPVTTSIVLSMPVGRFTLRDVQVQFSTKSYLRRPWKVLFWVFDEYPPVDECQNHSNFESKFLNKIMFTDAGLHTPVCSYDHREAIDAKKPTCEEWSCRLSTPVSGRYMLIRLIPLKNKDDNREATANMCLESVRLGGTIYYPQPRGKRFVQRGRTMRSTCHPNKGGDQRKERLLNLSTMNALRDLNMSGTVPGISHRHSADQGEGSLGGEGSPIGSGAGESSKLSDTPQLQSFLLHRDAYFGNLLTDGARLAILLRISQLSLMFRPLLIAHLRHRYGVISNLKARQAAERTATRAGSTSMGGFVVQRRSGDTGNQARSEKYNCSHKGRVIDFSNCGAHITDQSLVEMVSHQCLGLLSLDLSGCSLVTDSSVQVIASRLSRLSHLRLGDVPSLTDATVSTLCKQATNLISLVLWETVSEKAIAQLSALSKLRDVDFSGCVHFTDKAFAALIRGPNLRHIGAARCAQITDRLFVSDAKMKHLASLESINLDCCFNITDKSLYRLARHCTQLKAVSLAGNSDGHMSITDRSILSLAHNCPNLESLNLYRNAQLTDTSVLALGSKCKHLRHVSLAHCKQFNEIALQEMIGGCTVLQSINLTNLRITDATVLLLARLHRGLESLILMWCNEISNESLASLVSHTSLSLRTLALTGCYKLTEPMLVELATKCKTLDALELSWCKTDDACIVRLRSLLPNCKLTANEFRPQLSSHWGR